MKLTSTIMRKAAEHIKLCADMSGPNRNYFVCFAVEDAAGGSTAVRPELEALLVRDGKSLDGNWFKEQGRENGFVHESDIPGFAPMGPARQKLRAAWCLKIAAELEAQGR